MYIYMYICIYINIHIIIYVCICTYVNSRFAHTWITRPHTVARAHAHLATHTHTYGAYTNDRLLLVITSHYNWDAYRGWGELNPQPTPPNPGNPCYHRSVVLPWQQARIVSDLTPLYRVLVSVVVSVVVSV